MLTVSGRALQGVGAHVDDACVGAFVELVLAFSFAAETPEGVLMAFTPWRTGDDPPPLPLLDEFVSEDAQEEIAYEVEMQLYEADGDDALAGLPPLHRAVAWNALFSWGENAYFPGPASTALHWDADLELWTLMARTVPKTSLEVVQAMVRPLGQFATQPLSGAPERVGHIDDEGPVPPTLIYSHGRAPFEFD